MTKAGVAMSTDHLVDTFAVRIMLTRAVVLDILDLAYFTKESHAFVDAMNDALQSTFGADYSYRTVSKTHKVTNMDTGVIDGNSYLSFSFERRALIDQPHGRKDPE
jgi:hypothetical protein